MTDRLCDNQTVHSSSTFQYRLVRRIHVAVHKPGRPDNEQWQAYLAEIGRRVELIDAILVFTPDGSLSRAQRSLATDLWKPQIRKVPIAVVTPSLLVVRVVGALRWFMPGQIRAFLPRDIERAYSYAQLVQSEQRQAVERCVRELAREQGLPDPLAEN